MIAATATFDLPRVCLCYACREIKRASAGHANTKAEPLKKKTKKSKIALKKNKAERSFFALVGANAR